MKKNAKELYNTIVAAKEGELICTKYKNINYEYTITDALEQQGYKKGIDFDTVFNYNNYQTYIKKLSNITEYKEPMHNIQVGDIIYNSWGWEQTNIDFYQVVKTSKKTITIQRIAQKTTETNFMSGNTEPIKDKFINDETLTKKPYLFMNRWCVSFEYGAGGKLEENEILSCSWYA